MQRTLEQVYVIDVSAIMNLQGYNKGTAFTQNPKEREAAWANLVTMIQTGRVVTVFAAKGELERRSRDCYYRLKPYLRVFAKHDTTELIIRAGQICEQFPTLVPRFDQLIDREPADPYLIAYGEINGVTVVTDEKHKKDRTPQNRSGDHIPDVCDALNVDWLYFRDFAAIEKLV